MREERERCLSSQDLGDCCEFETSLDYTARSCLIGEGGSHPELQTRSRECGDSTLRMTGSPCWLHFPSVHIKGAGALFSSLAGRPNRCRPARANK